MEVDEKERKRFAGGRVKNFQVDIKSSPAQLVVIYMAVGVTESPE